ncbi:hypothetical protein CC2G_000367 [Coprinopsis cinerea AmutBmut pab1-1]|nr:hypothetical protein CC2G_000367 [Coprinopsis cinerea AmutBmut pab1-1]
MVLGGYPANGHQHCSICILDFVDHNALKRHWVDSDRHHYCEGCDIHFDDGNQLQNHLRSRIHQVPEFVCPARGCPRTFISRSAAVGHIDSQGCRFINRQTFNDNMCQADYYNYIVKEGVVAGSLSDQDIEDITLGSYARREGSMLVCICGTRHRNAHALRQHLRSPAHEPALYECPCCGFHRQTLSAILSHLESGACPGDRGQQELAIEDIWDMAVRAASGTW